MNICLKHRTVVLATTNPGKMREFQSLLQGTGCQIVPQSKLCIPSAAETGLTFVENALLKARHAAKHSGLPAIADDSGLAVDALGGAPGIHSARYGAPFVKGSQQDQAAQNCEKLLSSLHETSDGARTAHFHCVLVLLKTACDPAPLICQGTWEGAILQKAQGHCGFGYDPLFFVPSHGVSAAELPLAVKNQISHRARAVQSFLKHFARKLV